MEPLNAQTLARLAGVKLRARAVMEGVLSGLHKSPHQGQSVEFAEHKEYSPGDELRHLDWKAYGKFDKHYIKRFEHETNLRAYLVLDASGSMGFASGPLSKLEVAKALVGALAYLLVRQQDAAGVSVVADGRAKDLPPRASAAHLHAVMDSLEKVTAGGSTHLAAAADHLAESASPRSLVVWFTDLLDDRPEALRRLIQLQALRHDVAVFHLLDPAELQFPFEDPTLFLSPEDERRVEVHAREIRQSYLEEFGAFLHGIKRACIEGGVGYERVSTDDPLDKVLLRFLTGRRRQTSPGERG